MALQTISGTAEGMYLSLAYLPLLAGTSKFPFRPEALELIDSLLHDPFIILGSRNTDPHNVPEWNRTVQKYFAEDFSVAGLDMVSPTQFFLNFPRYFTTYHYTLDNGEQITEPSLVILPGDEANTVQTERYPLAWMKEHNQESVIVRNTLHPNGTARIEYADGSAPVPLPAPNVSLQDEWHGTGEDRTVFQNGVTLRFEP